MMHSHILKQCTSPFTFYNYYGLLRIGEVTESIHSIKAINVHETTNGSTHRLLIVLYTSKTHGLDKPPQKIKILGNKTVEITNSPLVSKHSINKAELGKFCPVEWTKRYIQLRGPVKHIDENLFILSDKSNVRAPMVRQLLREILNDFNLDSALYDTHSFRIGRATDLFKSGVSVENIKQLGRWKSNAVYRYLKQF